MAQFDTNGLVGAWLPAHGHFLDLSPTQADGYIQNPQENDWRREGHLWTYRGKHSSGRVTIPAKVEYDTQAYTIVICASWRAFFISGSDRVLETTGTKLMLYRVVSASLGIISGGVTTSLGILNTDAKTAIMTKAAGVVGAKGYKYGLHTHTSAAYNTALVGGPIGITLLHPQVANRKNHYTAILFYNVEKTEQEVANIYEYMENHISNPRTQSYHFLPGGPGGEVLAKGDFGAIAADRVEKSQVGPFQHENGLGLMIYSGPWRMQGERIGTELLKRVYLRNYHKTLYISNHGESLFGSWRWHIYRPAVSTITILLRDRFSIANGYSLTLHNSKIVQLYRYTAGVGTNLGSSAAILVDNVENLVWMTRAYSGEIKIYINGTLVITATDATHKTYNLWSFNASVLGTRFTIASSNDNYGYLHLKDVIVPQS